MPDPSFRTAYKCRDCGEESLYAADVDTWRIKHIEQHRWGKCGRCGHWRTKHHPTTEADRKYLKTGQSHCCAQPLGFGDGCFCPGDEIVQEPGW